MSAFRVLILCVATLLVACGSGGNSPAPASPAPPAGSTPPPVTIIDIAQPWAKAAPAAADMDEVILNRAANDAAAMPRFRSLLVARHGKLVAENYFGGADSSTVFDLRSVTKSVVSMLTGIALQTGKLSSVEATVGTYIDAPYALDPGDRAVTVRQLLTMSSRYQWNETGGDDYNLWVLSPDHIQFLLDRPTGRSYRRHGFKPARLHSSPGETRTARNVGQRTDTWYGWRSRPRPLPSSRGAMEVSSRMSCLHSTWW